MLSVSRVLAGAVVFTAGGLSERAAVSGSDSRDDGDRKPLLAFLAVSNDARNRDLDSVVCARVSASPDRPVEIPSIVPIEDRGAAVG